MTGAIEMGMAEADNGFVEILVSGTVTIHIRVVFAILFIRDGICIGAQLDKSKGDTGPGEGMPHFLSADEGIDIPGKWFNLLRILGGCRPQQDHPKEGKGKKVHDQNVFTAEDSVVLPGWIIQESITYKKGGTTQEAKSRWR